MVGGGWEVGDSKEANTKCDNGQVTAMLSGFNSTGDVWEMV